MTLTEFLNARLDEDEAAAKAALNADAQHEAGMPEAEMREAIDLASRRERNYDSPWWAANMKWQLDRRAWGFPTDPARAMREVEAKRKILAVHEHEPRAFGGPAEGPDPGFGCACCHHWHDEYFNGGWCDTVRALAAVYSDHPDYQEDWAVKGHETNA